MSSLKEVPPWSNASSSGATPTGGGSPAARRAGEGVFHGLDDDGRVDALFLRHGAGDLDEFDLVGSDGHEGLATVFKD